MRYLKPNSLLFGLIFLIASSLFAQEGTRNKDAKGAEINGKIMLIPFDPKLFMSEIDQKINEQTKWNFNTIREYFRHQLDAQLKLKLQSIDPVVSFYADSAKTAKDLAFIYQSTSLSYDILEKPTNATDPNKKQTGIKNGQVEVEINTDKKFMNTKITNKDLLDYLSKKYHCDYFVFINELDITKDINSYDAVTDTYLREVNVHYSILDKTGKTIAAGLATSSFSNKENNPKKIVGLAFTPVATFIAAKFATIIKPKGSN